MDKDIGKKQDRLHESKGSGTTLKVLGLGLIWFCFAF